MPGHISPLAGSTSSAPSRLWLAVLFLLFFVGAGIGAAALYVLGYFQK
jgi:membrane protein DedA with SNARE-associated domain